MTVETRSIDLACGGHIELTIDADFLAMSDADLTFVRDLARRLDRTQPKTPAAAPEVEETDDELPFRCTEPGCTRSFSRAQGLGRHMRSHGATSADARTTGSRGPFGCDDCDRRFRSLNALAAHRRTAHPAKVEEDWTPPEPARAAPEPAHRMAETRRQNDGWIALCSCLWSTPYPVHNKADAVQRLRDHIIEEAA